MNRGVLQLQSSPVQQMMAGNPSWWSMINSMRPPTHQQAASPTAFFPQFTPTSSSSSSSLPIPSWHDNQELPQSWSQLLLGGLVGEEEKGDIGKFQIQPKTMENWEEQQAIQYQASNYANSVVDIVKRENCAASSYVYGHENDEGFQQPTKPAAWSHQILMAAASSSPKSCVTSFGSNMLEFSGNKADGRHPPPDRSSECNSNATGGALKKARVQTSATQSTIKVRKEKLGDRITALHQLVSPFGKTDTASVLLEAMGYIRFLQSQIEALSIPYLGSGSVNMRQQQSVQGERNCIFPEDPGQDSHEERTKDLRSRGLCLVPVSCTLQVGSDNGADFWAPAPANGFR